MKKGDVFLCPVHSIATTLKSITGEGLACELVTKGKHHFLRYTITDSNLTDTYEHLLLKFRFFCTGLCVITIGHFWVEDVILDKDFRVVWKRENTILLEMDKEIDSAGPSPLTVSEFVSGQDVAGWIATKYPRVFNYHHIGLFLLRSSLAGEYLYADVLLNFFKIIEVVVHSRTNQKPKLNLILRESRALKIISMDDEEEMEEFYRLRGSDAAHDWDKVRGVTRRKAVECKMWAEELIIRDMLDRGKEMGERHVLQVNDSPQGATVKPKKKRPANNSLENRPPEL